MRNDNSRPRVEKKILLPSRLRSPPRSGFSWIDRRIVRDGFLAGLTAPEILLYFFLVTVADRDGLSFHGDRRTAAFLKLSELTLEQARRGLERKDLILYRAPLYQVLSLPDAPAHTSLSQTTLTPAQTDPEDATTPARSTPGALGDILSRMLGTQTP